MKEILRNTTILAIVCLGLLVVACSGKPASPKDVSTLFWEAVITNDIEKAKSLATPLTSHHVDSLDNESRQLKSVDVSEPVISESRAMVETVLHGVDENGEQSTFPTRTYLVKYDDEWRVDAEQTVNLLARDSVDDLLEEVGKTLSLFGEQLGDALSQGVEGFNESLNEKLPEIQRKLQELQSSEKFKSLGADLGKVLSEGIEQFTDEVSQGLEELSKDLEEVNTELEKGAADDDPLPDEPALETEAEDQAV